MRMRVASWARTAGTATVLGGVTALTVASLTVPAGAAPRQAGGVSQQRHDPSFTRVFRYTGHTQRFTVPRGVRFVTITAAGASGQSNHNAAAGLGAIVRSTVPVSPGSTLLVTVGGTGSRGGFNGGGAGPRAAGRGGGASTVRTFSRLLVEAGGGGGAGAAGTCARSAGGDGGNAGFRGATGRNCLVRGSGGHGGGAGLRTRGGAGGAGGRGSTRGTTGGNGALHFGGAGKTTSRTFAGASGGGGGGYYGGGGGGSGGRTVRGTFAAVGGGGGGGGGSSLGHVTGLNFGPPSVKISYSVTVPVTITTSSTLPAGVVGRFYRTTLSASGGSPPYTWSRVSGSLPTGLALQRSGVISGTPTRAGVRFFTLRVRDRVGRSATKRFRLAIEGRADLAIRLRNLGTFRSHRHGQYQIAVTNTGSAPTSVWRPTEVTLTLPRGLDAVRGVGSLWQCRTHLRSMLCTRRAVIHPHQTTTITATVLVTARAGSVLRAQATVFPTDATPADNTATDSVVIRP